MKVSTITKILKIVEWIIFLGMLVAAALFVNKSFQNYQSNATGVQVLSQKVDSYVPPTMTICFEPYKKSTILQQYNIKDYSAFSLPEFSKNNTTWPLIYQEMSFKLGRDFNFTIKIDAHGRQEETYTINNSSLSENALRALEFEEIVSITTGICYSVTKG